MVELKEETQLDFARPLPDENNKDACILVGVDRFSRYPSAEVGASDKVNTIVKFIEIHIVNHGVPRNTCCDQAQGLGRKNS